MHTRRSRLNYPPIASQLQDLLLIFERIFQSIHSESCGCPHSDLTMTQVTLETNRLILRPPTQADASSIQRAASDRRIAETMISISHPYPQGEAERYIQRQMIEFEAGNSVSLIIDRKADPAFCGVIEIRDIDREHTQAELSYWLTVGAWGQGYMSEALERVVRFCFKDLELNRLYAYHMTKNSGSGRVLQKNSFIQEGVLRQRVRKWGVFEDVKLWAILRQDWHS
jgi:[ribosomal protein S5]-alanine N-acetyltransferase